jgi:hypothetical protein
MSEPRIKGMGAINIRNWFDERLGAGWYTRTAREHDPDWPDRLLPGDWYSVRTTHYVYKRGYEQLGGYESVEKLMEAASGEVAIKDLNGILRAFLWAASPKMFLRTVPKIWDTYANFATTEVLGNEVGHFTVKVSSFAPDLVDWMTASWEGFLIPALELAGGKDPKVAIHDVKQTPGADTWEFIYELTYR